MGAKEISPAHVLKGERFATKADNIESKIVDIQRKWFKACGSTLPIVLTLPIKFALHSVSLALLFIHLHLFSV
jgi:hypothetical protein